MAYSEGCLFPLDHHLHPHSSWASMPLCNVVIQMGHQAGDLSRSHRREIILESGKLNAFQAVIWGYVGCRATDPPPCLVLRREATGGVLRDYVLNTNIHINKYK